MNLTTKLNESLQVESNYQRSNQLALELTEQLSGTSYGGVIIGKGAKVLDLLKTEWYLDSLLESVLDDLEDASYSAMGSLEAEVEVVAVPMTSVGEVLRMFRSSTSPVEDGTVLDYRVKCIVTLKSEVIIDSDLLLVLVVGDIDLDYEGIFELESIEPSALSLVGVTSLTPRVALSKGIH